MKTKVVEPYVNVIRLTSELLDLVKEKEARDKLELLLTYLESMESNDGEIYLEI